MSRQRPVESGDRRLFEIPGDVVDCGLVHSRSIIVFALEIVFCPILR